MNCLNIELIVFFVVEKIVILKLLWKFYLNSMFCTLKVFLFIYDVKCLNKNL
jgi:hypothetical protein